MRQGFTPVGHPFLSETVLLHLELKIMDKQCVDKYNSVTSPTATYWVYVISNIKLKTIRLGITFNIQKQIVGFSDSDKLVYYQPFQNPFDALAHKHLLNSLSQKSLMHNIKQYNPTLENLMSEILP